MPRVTWQVTSGTKVQIQNHRIVSIVIEQALFKCDLWLYLVISFQLYGDREKPQFDRGLNTQKVREFRTCWGWCQTQCWGQMVHSEEMDAWEWWPFWEREKRDRRELVGPRLGHCAGTSTGRSGSMLGDFRNSDGWFKNRATKLNLNPGWQPRKVNSSS